MVKYITCILDSFEANLPITPNVKAALTFWDQYELFICSEFHINFYHSRVSTP